MRVVIRVTDGGTHGEPIGRRRKEATLRPAEGSVVACEGAGLGAGRHLRGQGGEPRLAGMMPTVLHGWPRPLPAMAASPSRGWRPAGAGGGRVRPAKHAWPACGPRFSIRLWVAALSCGRYGYGIPEGQKSSREPPVWGGRPPDGERGPALPGG
ncbi:hypothetical protein KSP39_PZI020720 [Platanthera zijinensis]|uniref:Uncharacterized protein n=1 Tax=Platanthera zijinensis TaxID=2320716 RepID=A0AAP0B0M5_9ASPA